MLLAGALHAAQTPRVLVVDAELGPGAHFASVGAALAAAVEGDVVLVRRAVHGEDVELADKGLTLVAAPGPTRPVLGGLAVRRVPAGSRVSVRGFDLRLDSSSTLAVEQCAGPVWFEDVHAVHEPGALFTNGMRVADSEAFVLARSSLAIPWQSSFPSLWVERSSVQLFDSRLTGADARDQLFSHGEPGGTALWVLDGRAFLSGVTLRGGTGSDIVSPICALRAGNGGTGLQVSGQSRVELQDCTLVPGAGGTSCGADGLPGQPMLVEGGVVRDVPGAARGCRLEALGALGRETTAVLAGRPGDLALLLLSPRAAAGSASPLFRGRLLLGDPLHIAASAFVPAGGELRVPLAIPRSLGTRAPALHAQGLFLDPAAGLVLSGPSSLVALGTHALAADPPR
ncbi:MAG TPA: hypothetical protein VF530_22325 [Planctomycetota bacterium]